MKVSRPLIALVFLAACVPPSEEAAVAPSATSVDTAVISGGVPTTEVGVATTSVPESTSTTEDVVSDFL